MRCHTLSRHRGAWLLRRTNVEGMPSHNTIVRYYNHLNMTRVLAYLCCIYCDLYVVVKFFFFSNSNVILITILHTRFFDLILFILGNDDGKLYVYHVIPVHLLFTIKSLAKQQHL